MKTITLNKRNILFGFLVLTLGLSKSWLQTAETSGTADLAQTQPADTRQTGSKAPAKISTAAPALGTPPAPKEPSGRPKKGAAAKKDEKPAADKSGDKPADKPAESGVTEGRISNIAVSDVNPLDPNISGRNKIITFEIDGKTYSLTANVRDNIRKKGEEYYEGGSFKVATEDKKLSGVIASFEDKDNGCTDCITQKEFGAYASTEKLWEAVKSYALGQKQNLIRHEKEKEKKRLAEEKKVAKRNKQIEECDIEESTDGDIDLTLDENFKKQISCLTNTANEANRDKRKELIASKILEPLKAKLLAAHSEEERKEVAAAIEVVSKNLKVPGFRYDINYLKQGALATSAIARLEADSVANQTNRATNAAEIYRIGMLFKGGTLPNLTPTTTAQVATASSWANTIWPRTQQAIMRPTSEQNLLTQSNGTNRTGLAIADGSGGMGMINWNVNWEDREIRNERNSGAAVSTIPLFSTPTTNGQTLTPDGRVVPRAGTGNRSYQDRGLQQRQGLSPQRMSAVGDIFTNGYTVGGV